MLPGPTDDVLIDVAPGGLIEHRAGATTIRSLRAKGNLQISGGSVEVLADSSINGTFSLAGGALAGAGTPTLAGAGNRWDGDAMTDSVTTRIAAGAELFVTGLLGDLILADRTLLNDGTIIVDRGRPGEVLIQSSGGAAICNLGTF